MINAAQSIQIRTPIPTFLRSGDIVTIGIVKKLADNKWAVSVNGTVFPAFSLRTLIAGSTMRAKVDISKGTLYLSILTETPNPIRDLIARMGAVNDPLSEIIMSAMMHCGMKISNTVFERIRRLLMKMDKHDQRSARLMAQIVSGNLEFTDSQVEKIFYMLSYGEERHHRKKGDDNRSKKDADQQQYADQIRKTATSEDEAGNLLQLYNHVRSTGTEHWIVIPYVCGGSRDNPHIRGNIRFLYNTNEKKIEKMVLIANDDENVRFNFDCTMHKDAPLMRLFMSDPSHYPSIRKKIRELGIKLQNKGVKIDDIIYDESGHDGFNPMTDSGRYKTVDTMT